jgi:hypothetical protein
MIRLASSPICIALTLTLVACSSDEGVETDASADDGETSSGDSGESGSESGDTGSTGDGDGTSGDGDGTSGDGDGTSGDGDGTSGDGDGTSGDGDGTSGDGDGTSGDGTTGDGDGTTGDGDGTTGDGDGTVDCYSLTEAECSVQPECTALMGTPLLTDATTGNLCMGDAGFAYCMVAATPCLPALTTACKGSDAWELWSTCGLPPGWTSCQPGPVSGPCP